MASGGDAGHDQSVAGGSDRPGWPTRLRRLWPHRNLIVAAFVLLGVARAAIVLLSFRRVVGWLGPLDVESARQIPEWQTREARRIGRIVRQVSGWTPWKSNCFPQALTARVLLRRHRITSTVYLGVRHDEARTGLEAHAWVRAGEVAVTGGRGERQYGVVARFGADPVADGPHG